MLASGFGDVVVNGRPIQLYYLEQRQPPESGFIVERRTVQLLWQLDLHLRGKSQADLVQ